MLEIHVLNPFAGTLFAAGEDNTADLKRLSQHEEIGLRAPMGISQSAEDLTQCDFHLFQGAPAIGEGQDTRFRTLLE